VDKSVVTIGEKIKYSIIISKDKFIEVKPIEFPGTSFGDFAVKDFGVDKKSYFGREKIIYWHILDTYITGKSVIPKITIYYKEKKTKEYGEIAADEIPIEVKSVLNVAGGAVGMRDIKGPLDLPTRLRFYILGLIILVIGVSAVFYLRTMRQKAALRQIKMRPAYEIAIEQIEALRAKDYIKQGKVKQYYIEISDIVRHYLENGFGLKAPEMTTEEFLHSVREWAKFKSEHKALLKDFLFCCDLVKFAKYSPSEEEINSVFNSAKRFVDQTHDFS
jgi:hypothetical protein